MDKIKESFDSLPIAACFFDKNGIVQLVNHRMLAVMNNLRPDGIQTLAEMAAAIKSPPAGILCINPQLRIYRFPDGRALRFSHEQITTKAGLRYTQVTAADVTELMQQQAKLKEENEKLAQANERLRRLFEQMPEIIREEETLQMKLRVHDDIGHSILASRRALLRQAGLEEIKENAVLWDQAISVLYRSNQIRADSDSLEATISKVSKMGVRVLTEGSTPDMPSVRKLAVLSITECAANCARHADGTELYVRFGQKCGCTEFILTNNGTPPREKIREGGGLSMLRRRVEEAGGQMEIQSFPCFELMISIPQEVAQHESNDR